jgi:hypothetical protein
VEASLRLERPVATDRDRLWGDGLALLQALTCHLCRMETRLLPLVELAVINGGTPPAPAAGFLPCRRPMAC